MVSQIHPGVPRQAEKDHIYNILQHIAPIKNRSQDHQQGLLNLPNDDKFPFHDPFARHICGKTPCYWFELRQESLDKTEHHHAAATENDTVSNNKM